MQVTVNEVVVSPDDLELYVDLIYRTEGFEIWKIYGDSVIVTVANAAKFVPSSEPSMVKMIFVGAVPPQVAVHIWLFMGT